MANGRILFLTEAKQIEKIRNAIRYAQKLNGTQVLLSDTNQNEIREAAAYLEKAARILREIK